MNVPPASSRAHLQRLPDHAARARRANPRVAPAARATGREALRVELCRPGELGATEIAQWHAFQARAGLDDPFLSPEFARVVGEVTPSARVAIVHDGPDLVGYLPFMAHHFGVARSLGGYLANQHAFIPSGVVEWSLERVLRAAGIEVFEFARHVASQRPAGGALRELGVPVIDVSGGYDAFLAAARRDHARFVASLLRRQRRLQRRDPELSFEFDTRDLAAVATLCEWKAAQERRTGQPPLHAQPVVRELMERVVASRGPAMTGSVSCLRSGDRPLAVYVDLRSTTIFAGWMTAYDASRSADSPGTVALLHLIEAAAGTGARLFNLGPGTSDYKQRLATGAIAAIEGTFGTRALRQRLLTRLERVGDPLP